MLIRRVARALAAIVKNDIVRVSKMIKQAGIKLE